MIRWFLSKCTQFYNWIVYGRDAKKLVNELMDNNLWPIKSNYDYEAVSVPKNRDYKSNPEKLLWPYVDIEWGPIPQRVNLQDIKWKTLEEWQSEDGRGEKINQELYGKENYENYKKPPEMKTAKKIIMKKDGEIVKVVEAKGKKKKVSKKKVNKNKVVKKKGNKNA